jgi:hypothetical protein
MDKCNELGCKLAAKLLLQNKSKGIITPNYDEWIGVGLLERDDELKRLPKDNNNDTPIISSSASVLCMGKLFQR